MDNNGPLVSVIIPSYNRADLIKRAIDSALEQTYNNIEVIVVNDGSKDNTDEIVNSIKSKKLKLISLEKNGGLSNARNTGIKAAQGEYIAFLDSDDEWDKTKTEKQMDLFLNSNDKNLGAVFSYCYEKDEAFDIVRERNKGFLRGELHKEFLKGYCPPSPTLFIMKKEALDEIDHFDKQIKNFEDLDLYIRISKNYTFDYVPEFLATKYDHLGDRLATNIESRLKGIKTFMGKWKKYIVENGGKESYLKIRNNWLRDLASSNLNISYKSARGTALKCLRILLSIPEKSPRLYIKAILGLIVGIDTINGITKKNQ